MFIVGSAPAEQDEIDGKPFRGGVGEELSRYLRRTVYLNRSEFYITNLVKWRTDDEDNDPSDQDIQRDEQELIAEINSIQPALIVAVGPVVARWFFGSDVDLDKYAGLPKYSSRFNCPIFIIHSPAAGLKQPDRYAARLEDDFKRLGQFIRGELYVPQDAHAPTYSLVHGGSLHPVLTGMDTEGSAHKPWCLSFSTTAGFGGVSKSAVSVHPESPTVFHYCLHDLPVLRTLGVAVNLDLIEDTNILAYLLGNEPKRLKALAYRHCGMEMDEYEDIIKEAEARVCREYLQQIIEAKCPECQGSGEIQVPWKRQPKCKACKGLGRTVLPAVLPEISGTTPNQHESLADLVQESQHRFKRPRKGPVQSRFDFQGIICTDCGGSGKDTRSKIEKCPSCHGDTTIWPAPIPQIIINDDGTDGVYKPQSVGRRVRRWLDNGVDDLREKWYAADPSIREPVERTLGQLRSTSLDDVADQGRVIEYAARDADATLRVYQVLRPMVSALGLDKAYEIDKSIIPAIDAMQRNGILLDREHFANLAIEFEKQKAEVQEQLATLVGRKFNPASSKQVGNVLYGQLGLKAPKVTKSGADSTEEKALQMLKIKYFDHESLGPIIEAILEHRELDKLLGTYVYPLPKLCGRDGRLRTQFSLTRTTTGRLASSNPNLQNIPTRSELGRRIRGGFMAGAGRVLVSVDLDQIELRVCAHLANDIAMIEVFKSGRDIHTSTAAKMFGVPYEQVTPDQRRAAKTINFGTLYGMSAYRLRNELALEGIRISKVQSEAFLEAWFRAYPGVRAYMDRCHQEARKNGYVRTLFGHLRRLPNVHSSLEQVREEALRQAGNAPTQGTAAEILKIATANVFKRLPDIRRYGYCELLLNIHDELILECQEEIAPFVIEIVAWEMANAVQLNVPLGAKGNSAKTWGKLK